MRPVLALAGCHDYHGYVDWSNGDIYINIRGMAPDFSCSDPGGNWMISRADRQTMCDVVSSNMASCGDATTASFGVTKDPTADGGYAFEFTCGQTRHH